MPSEADKDYYLERAEAELTLGDEAGDSRAAWAHFQLAGRYLDLVYRDGEEREADEEAILVGTFE
ncbi:MAG: hypothetical protein ACT4N8_07505 [Sphingosinicella sp.]|uniref:hypothetical protein n=1 Tax=Sphingosinicella sp. TaxID=1917971 RepID=UPI004038422B